MPGKSYLLFCALLVGCATSSRAVTLREPATSPPAPEAAPAGHVIVPKLVRYPDTDVFYVSNARGECYCFDGMYYRFQEGYWFYAPRLTGPWAHIEMKYVPPDLFRVRGHLPEE